MRLQILSDLHLETESFSPVPAPGAEALLLAGDIDARWEGYRLFAGWPVPIYAIAGNHEFDRREWNEAWPALRAHLQGLGIRLLEKEAVLLQGADGRRHRLLACTRWCDFDLFGPSRRDKALRAARYFVDVMRSTRNGLPFDAAAVREEALDSRAWLAAALRQRPPADPADPGHWHSTVVMTHFGPSLKSADPRYGAQPATASFCNADDALLPAAQLWIHGHLHCRHDYTVDHGPAGRTRVVCSARGHSHRGEADGHDPLACVLL